MFFVKAAVAVATIQLYGLTGAELKRNKDNK